MVMGLALVGCQDDPIIPIIVVDDVVTLPILGQEPWDIVISQGDALTVEIDASERISTHLVLSVFSDPVPTADHSGVKRVRYTTRPLTRGTYRLTVMNDFDVVGAIQNPLDSLLGSNDVAVVARLQPR